MRNWWCSFLIADVCENLALGKKASVSSKDGKHYPMRGVDGYTVPNSGCVSLDLSAGRQIWEVDIGQAYVINVVNIYHEMIGKYMLCHFSFLTPCVWYHHLPSRDILPRKTSPVALWRK